MLNHSCLQSASPKTTEHDNSSKYLFLFKRRVMIFASSPPMKSSAARLRVELVWTGEAWTAVGRYQEMRTWCLLPPGYSGWSLRRSAITSVKGLEKKVVIWVQFNCKIRKFHQNVFFLHALFCFSNCPVTYIFIYPRMHIDLLLPPELARGMPCYVLERIFLKLLSQASE